VAALSRCDARLQYRVIVLVGDGDTVVMIMMIEKSGIAISSSGYCSGDLFNYYYSFCGSK